MPIQYTSIYTDERGVTHFRDVAIEPTERFIGPGIPPLGASQTFPAAACYFLTFPPGLFVDWHPAPRRLFHCFLSGICEVTVDDGEVRTFGPGDIVLAEDTAGRGHVTRNPGAEPTLMVVVAVED